MARCLRDRGTQARIFVRRAFSAVDVSIREAYCGSHPAMRRNSRKSKVSSAEQQPRPSVTTGTSGVAALLHKRKAAILGSWEARVASEIRGVEFAGRALLDDLPRVLDDLAAWLTSDHERPQTSLVTRGFAHLTQRPLAQVLHEYRLLRETIIEELLGAEAATHLHGGASASTDRIEELARLNAGLDALLSQSIEQSVEDRDRRSAAERTIALQAMRESETRYRSLFDSIDEGFCIIEVLFDGERPIDYRFLQVNPAFERHTGLENATGKRMLEMVPTHDAHWFETYGRVARTGTPERFENAAQAMGRFYDVYAFRVGEPAQRQVAVLFNDITERHRAQDALRESEELKAFLLKLSDGLRPLSDATAIHETVTRTAMDYFGADRCYFCEIEDDLATIRRDASRADLPSVVGVYPIADSPIFKAVVDAGRPFIVDDMRRPGALDDGLRRLCIQMQVISVLNVPVIKNGKPAGVLSISQCRPRMWTDSEVALAMETAEGRDSAGGTRVGRTRCGCRLFGRPGSGGRTRQQARHHLLRYRPARHRRIRGRPIDPRGLQRRASTDVPGRRQRLRVARRCQQVAGSRLRPAYRQAAEHPDAREALGRSRRPNRALRSVVRGWTPRSTSAVACPTLSSKSL